MDASLVKGLYVQCALDVVERAAGADVARAIQSEVGLPADISSLRNYPQRQLSHVVKLAKDRCFPTHEDNEVVRRFGAAAFDGFAATIVGKVGVALASVASPEQVGRALARMHNASTETSVMEAIDLHARGFRLRCRGAVHAWYQLGLTEAGFARNASRAATVTLEVRKHAVDALWMPASDCEFDLVVLGH